MGLKADGVLGPVTIAALRDEMSTRFAPRGPSVFDTEFSPGGRFLAAVNRAGEARIYRVSNGAVQVTLPHDSAVTSAGFHLDGEVLVTGSRDGRATIWHWRDQRVLRTIRHPGVRTAEFSPDGRLVLTAGASGVRLWEWRTGKLWAVIRSGPALDGSFSRDGRQVVTALREPRAEIWDLPITKGPPIRSAQLGGHDGPVTSASFSRDGLAVTASEDGTARLWSPYGDLDVVRPLPTRLSPNSEFAFERPNGAPAANGRRYHAAKDWFAPPGTPVRAPVTGVVVDVGLTGNGGTVYILAKDGKVWVFRNVAPRVRRGAVVRAGLVIASVLPGSSRPHAHIEVWKTAEDGYRFENMLDPLIFFRGGG
jgi:murein DD-endopeptidase MepM/ murein hydrolase activator NlpD